MLKVKLSAANIGVGLLCLSLSLAALACGGAPAANNGASPAEAQALAQGAVNRMDGGGQPAAGGQSAGTQSTATVNTGKGTPAWVNSVDSVYDRSQYVAAVGNASDRTMAERNALANLTAIFGQSIQADQTITNTYQEAVRSGVTAGWSDDIAMQNTIKTSTAMDTLVGAEIREVWYDSKNTYYAVAVMEKAKTASLYNDMINANHNMINNLLAMSAAEKNSLEGFSRYQLAAAAADINITYGNVLKVIGAEPSVTLVKGDDYRREAVNITKSIPVGVTVANDKAGRIQKAFEKSFTDLGFRAGGTNARYVVNVDITISPVELNNPNKFARIELNASLTDTVEGAVLLPYSFNSREGHTSVSEAENRAFAAAERKVNAEYTKYLQDYLAKLVPQKK